jgi:HSP20 family protein
VLHEAGIEAAGLRQLADSRMPRKTRHSVEGLRPLVFSPRQIGVGRSAAPPSKYQWVPLQGAIRPNMGCSERDEFLVRQENEMMNLVYYQPWSLMDRWHRELDSRRSEASQPSLTNASTWTPLVDLQEESDRFVVRADVPGVELKDIEVSADDGTLTISGERLAREHVKSDGFEHIERVTGRFLRRFSLPDSAQAEAIKARYTDGVLEIEIPKQPRVETKRIAVTVN